MNKRALFTWFFLVIAAMAWVTIRASMHESVVTAAGPLVASPWGLATLFDAYFAFLTFYLWLAYKERRWSRRLLWLTLILLLGNFAMAAYVLIELARLRGQESFETLLVRRYG